MLLFLPLLLFLMIVMNEVERPAVDSDAEPDKGDADCQRNNRVYQHDGISFLFSSIFESICFINCSISVLTCVGLSPLEK